LSHISNMFLTYIKFIYIIIILPYSESLSDISLISSRHLHRHVF
jgi:hypothetical protein